MGDACNKKNMIAVTRAKGQQTGDIFSEAERVKNFSAEQRFYYEDRMAKDFGVNLNQPKRGSVWSVIKKHKSGSEPGFKDFDRRLFAKPSERFSSKFNDAINARIAKWVKSSDKSPESYRSAVGKDVGDLIKALDTVVLNSSTMKERNLKLKAFGLNMDTIYDARKYLDWLKDGDPFFKKAWANKVVGLGNNLAEAQAKMEVIWSLSNGTDLLRVFSHYAPKNPAAIIKGGFKALVDSKGVPFRRIGDLEKKGVYGSQNPEVSSKNDNLFSWSVTAQKNIAYNIAKAAGDDPQKAMSKLLFEGANAWDVPPVMRDSNANLVFGLVRYPINEARWHYQTVKGIFEGDAKSRSQNAVNYLLYNAAKAFVLGAPSLVPAPLMAAINQDENAKKVFEEIEAESEKNGFNLIKIVSSQAFKSVGIDDLYLDLSRYNQPFGGSVGARAKSIGDTAMKVGGAVGGAGLQLIKGNMPAAAVNVLAAVSALNNLINFTKGVKLLDPANSFLTTKLLRTTAENLANEFIPEKATQKYMKDILGDMNVRRDKKEPGLGALPSLPKLK